jgi:epoxyqueuosine reductase
MPGSLKSCPAFFFASSDSLSHTVSPIMVLVASLSEKVKQFALEAGFHKVGIVRAEELQPEGGKLAEWLTRGYHGEMAWMERDSKKRSDPQLLLPEAKSLVVVALNYYTPHEHADAAEIGKISRYAWGDDYHDIVREKLGHLLEKIKELLPAANGKICVDTAPVMDKAWAVRAGIGWLGKHTNVISTDYGSWIFIGEILLDIELEYDEEIVPDRCGTCTACIDACPTGAIIEPYLVDSRKCISYATIELRSDELPPEIAKDQEGWLYGCDICQDVCPWNRFEKPTDEARFEPRSGETSIAADEILSLSHEEYVERFRRSAIKRAKLGGLQRNARHLKESRE